MAIIGIHAQNVDPVLDGMSEIAMQKAQRADADREQRDALQKLEQTDEQQGNGIFSRFHSAHNGIYGI